MTNLINNSCTKTPELLKESDINQYLSEISGWAFDKVANIIFCDFQFKNYYKTTAFVNAVVWTVHQEDHHPDITFGYNKCHIEFSTHSVQGLSINDFICAAKINILLPS